MLSRRCACAFALSGLILRREQGLVRRTGHLESYRLASKNPGARVRSSMRAQNIWFVGVESAYRRAGPAASPLRLKARLARSGISDALDSGRETAVRALIPGAGAHDCRRETCSGRALSRPRRMLSAGSGRSSAHRAPARPNGDRLVPARATGPGGGMYGPPLQMVVACRRCRRSSRCGRCGRVSRNAPRPSARAGRAGRATSFRG